MKTKLSLCLILTFTLFQLSFSPIVYAKPLDKVKQKERCKVCGMFVAKFLPWLTQIIAADGSIAMFDGPKDMFAYYFEPDQYGRKPVQTADTIFLKDYYSMEWINAREAFYVIGSDVYGPMGHELIPFSSMDAAKNFKKDHKGKNVLTFNQVTLELINSMRTGQTMK